MISSPKNDASWNEPAPEKLEQRQLQNLRGYHYDLMS